MTGKLYIALMLLCANQMVFGNDSDYYDEPEEKPTLEDLKNAALKQIRLHRKAVRDAYTNTSHMFHTRPMQQFTIEAQKKAQGHSLMELNKIEIPKIRDGFSQKADLIGCPKKVYECMEKKMVNSISKVEKAFKEVYLPTLADLTQQARQNGTRVTEQWSWRHHDVVERFHVQCDRATEQIKTTNNTVYVQSLMAKVDKAAKEAVTVTLSLLDMYIDYEIRFDRTLEKGPLANFRNTGRKIVDEFIEGCNNCILAK